jgi:hypothetical protein
MKGEKWLRRKKAPLEIMPGKLHLQRGQNRRSKAAYVGTMNQKPRHVKYSMKYRII